LEPDGPVLQCFDIINQIDADARRHYDVNNVGFFGQVRKCGVRAITVNGTCARIHTDDPEALLFEIPVDDPPVFARGIGRPYHRNQRIVSLEPLYDFIVAHTDKNSSVDNLFLTIGIVAVVVARRTGLCKDGPDSRKKNPKVDSH
jgi:hypothetical protein